MKQNTKLSLIGVALAFSAAAGLHMTGGSVDRSLEEVRIIDTEQRKDGSFIVTNEGTFRLAPNLADQQFMPGGGHITIERYDPGLLDLKEPPEPVVVDVLDAQRALTNMVCSSRNPEVVAGLCLK